MATVMTNKELAQKMKDVATKYNTIYMLGVFGAPVTESVITSKARQYASWYTAARQKAFRKLIGKNYFGFDCVCLVKALLWGWNGDSRATYGGAKYASNGVPDIDPDQMISVCKNVSTDFTDVQIGEAVWVKGHIGIYIGDGLAVECTPSWDNNVQITACNCAKSGYHRRNWTKHGKLPYVEYVVEKVEVVQPTVTNKSEYAVGDVVYFHGNKHYTSSYATAIGRTCKPGKVKITARNLKGKHPYHGVAVSGGGSTAYGWLNAADLGEVEAAYSPKVGDKVKLTKNAPVYGKSYKFDSWVYSCTMFVREVKDSRVVVATQKTGGVIGAVDKMYLTKV
jgi:hypothetical protein